MPLKVVKLSDQNSFSYLQKAYKKRNKSTGKLTGEEVPESTQTVFFDQKVLDKRGEASARRLIATNESEGQKATLGLIWEEETATK